MRYPPMIISVDMIEMSAQKESAHSAMNNSDDAVKKHI